MMSRSNCSYGSTFGTCVASVLFNIVALLCGSEAQAGTLADVFSPTGTLAGLKLEPLGDALANTVASTYPVASASSSVI
jgi:hypothetical protein